MMVTGYLALVLLMPVAHAFVSTGTLRPPALVMSPTTLSMGMEEGHTFDPATRSNLEKIFQQNAAERFSLSEVEASLGMPWKSSIDHKVKDDELLFMQFWEWQMSYMQDNLSNLRVQACTDGKTDFSYKENTKKKARIVNMCASSDEYRKIRMTYYDAGDNAQVFNSLWYPDLSYNLPVLGIDVLAFNRKKYLAIVDFQPLHETEQEHDSTYEHILRPIKNKYDSMKGRMSSKFYDETKFFSKEMLFARFDDESIVSKDLFPAFQAYVQTHLELVRSTEANPSQSNFVLKRQKAYDTYSAERDPATGLFAAMFGGEWANDFVHNFLFSMSAHSKSSSSVSSTGTQFMGGPPPSKKPQSVPEQQKHAARVK